MRRLLVVISILMLSAPFVQANSGDATWISSNTATADTTKSLCGTNKKALFHGACVNDAGGGGTLTIYNSRGSATTPVMVWRSTAAITSGCNYYDVQLSSGLTYSTSVANDNITILYNCY